MSTPEQQEMQESSQTTRITRVSEWCPFCVQWRERNTEERERERNVSRCPTLDSLVNKDQSKARLFRLIGFQSFNFQDKKP